MDRCQAENDKESRGRRPSAGDLPLAVVAEQSSVSLTIGITWSQRKKQPRMENKYSAPGKSTRRAGQR